MKLEDFIYSSKYQGIIFIHNIINPSVCINELLVVFLWGSSKERHLPLYRLKGPIINKACKSIIHHPLIHRPEIKRGYSVIFKMGPLPDNK